MDFPPERWAVETPLGKARVLFIESDADDNYWTCVILANRAIVTFRQNQLRLGRSYTDGIDFSHEDMKGAIG